LIGFLVFGLLGAPLALLVFGFGGGWLLTSAFDILVVERVEEVEKVETFAFGSLG